LQIAAEIITASKIAKTLADLDGAGTDVEFAVLFRMVEIWRARRDSNSLPPDSESANKTDVGTAKKG